MINTSNLSVEPDQAQWVFLVGLLAFFGEILMWVLAVLS